jgi:hypothetical protein
LSSRDTTNESVRQLSQHLGNARYIDTQALLEAFFNNRPFVETLDLNLGRPHRPDSANASQLMVIVSFDGAELHSTAGAIFGFLRVVNQLDFTESPLMQAPILLAQCSESRCDIALRAGTPTMSRSFFRETLPTVLAGLCRLRDQTDGVPVLCVDDKCEQEVMSHSHSHPFAFKIVCDMKCLKEIGTRQGGGAQCGCLLCDRITNIPLRSTSVVRQTPAVLFTDAIVKEKSDKWKVEYDKYCRRHPGASTHEFELSDEGKKWSFDNASFSGEWALKDVHIDEMQIDLLHLQLRLVPVRTHNNYRHTCHTHT